MALDSTMIANLIRQFKANPGLMDTAILGDDSVLPSLASMLNISKPSQGDLDEIKNIAKAMGGTNYGQRSGVDLSSLDSINKKYGGYFDAVSGNKAKGITSILRANPTAMAIETGLDALGEASHTAADAIQNNYNKLAEAILIANRSMSGSQTERYGKSSRERAAEMSANERQRRGNNLAIWANAIGNIVDKFTGKVERDNILERQAKMRPLDKEMNMSGQYYDAQRKMYGF